MSRKEQSMRDAIALVPSSKGILPQEKSSLHEMRSALAISEHEDANLTGMTRSLDRRLLALNLQPVPPASESGCMKVA